MFILLYKPQNWFLLSILKILNINAHIYHKLLNSYKSENVIGYQIIIVILFNGLTIILKFLIIFNYSLILLLF